jgi:hypothetical protein
MFISMMTNLHGTDILVFSSHPFGSDEIRTSELMDHMALGRRVFFIEKPIIGKTKKATFFYTKTPNKVTVVQPYLPDDHEGSLLEVLEELIADEHLSHLTIWTDCREGLRFLQTLKHESSVFDKAPGGEKLRRSDEQLMILEADLILSSCHCTKSIHADIDDINSDQRDHVYITSELDLLNQRSSRQVLNSRSSLISRYLSA